MKKFFIQTFGCQMNQADSEKINMVLLQSGFMKVGKWQDADVVIFNTCSVRQKGEDRVFSMLEEIEKYNKNHLVSSPSPAKERAGVRGIISGITGCMVRKTGIAKRYTTPHSESLPLRQAQGAREGEAQLKHKRVTAKKIELLSKADGIFNCDDKLFPRHPAIDFTLRIEETKYMPLILTEIYGEKIGQEDKFDDYLKQVQQRENPFSANVIIQTGCDNYCTFCIVPYTRGAEISRKPEDILEECKTAVENGAKEITLLGQNVNSYGKQFYDKKLWNSEKSTWNTGTKKLKIGIDIDDTLVEVWCPTILEIYNRKFHDILKFDDIHTFDFNGIQDLRKEYKKYALSNKDALKLESGAKEVIQKLKSQGNTLYIITSRSPEERKDTEKFLEKEFGKDFFQEIVFILESGEDTKYKAAQKYKLDIVLDDAPHHIKSYQKQCPKIKTIIFTQTWNQDIPENNSSLFRIANWEELESTIEKSMFSSPFGNLLRDIDTIPGLKRVRFTSSNPHDMTRDVLDAHFDLKTPCNYLHFALQSGNNQMLKKMNRKHSYEQFRDMVEYLRSRDPLFAISTDIIVGYSGETEDMFQDTVHALRECVFDYAYIARYSVRPGTLAAKMYPDDVPNSVKAERWHILNEILLENVQKRNTLMIGTTQDVLISGQKDDLYFGRTRNFKEVFINKSDKIKIGDIISVEITEIDRYVLVGKQV